MKRLVYLIFLLMIVKANAQENVTYQQPPQEILDLVDVPRAPSVYIDEGRNYMVMLFRNSYKSIEELSQEELRLGGLRIDPKTNIGSRVTYFNNIKVKSLKSNKAEIIAVKGLPSNPKLTNLRWSPDQTKMALTNTTKNGVEVWVLDMATVTATKLTAAIVNANVGNAINWFHDGQSILVKVTKRKPRLQI